MRSEAMALKFYIVITMHNVYFVQYDVPASFLAQVLDTGAYFVSQVLDTWPQSKYDPVQHYHATQLNNTTP